MTKPAPTFYVYILRCSDDSYYVGHTRDVTLRVARHNNGKGASWTARRLPVTLVYQESAATEEAAIKRERQLKGWSRKKKEALIEGDHAALKTASKRKGTQGNATPDGRR